VTISAQQYRDFVPHQKHVLKVLSAAQIFSGIASGAVISVGALLAVRLSGSESWGGSVTTVMTLGAAVAALPLARLAARSGRRVALCSGIVIALVGVVAMILAGVTSQFWVLLLGGALIGVGSAVNLQARFSATDLAPPDRKARDLSLVVWTTTVGSVAGPNLLGVGEAIGSALGLPQYTGIFVIAGGGMMAAALILFFGLRPDPALLLAQAAARNAGEVQGSADIPAQVVTVPRKPSLRESFGVLHNNRAAQVGLVAIVLGHAVMVAIMSMTSVHMDHHGASINLIGLTISLHVVGMYAFSPVVGMVTDRFGATRTMIVGALILLASTAFAGLGSENHALVTVGLILLGLGWSFATIAGAAHMSGSVGPDDRLAVQGASDNLMSLAGAGGGLLAGVSVAAVGYPGLNAGGAVLSVLLIVCVVALGTRERSGEYLPRTR
jgi:MFS family permease